MEDIFLWADPMKEEIKTACKLCLNCCGMIVSKNNGEIRIKGDPDHPLSRGYICKKGMASLGITNLPNRLRYPLRRVGERGSQKWERVSWEEAINGISSKLQDILNKYGSKSICVQSLPPKDIGIWQAFAYALGTPNFFRHDHHVCFTPILIADTLTFGNLMIYPNSIYDDGLKTRTFVLWGVNLPETNPAKARVIELARKSGAKLIVVDPRPIGIAKDADIWLRVRPGTDLALSLGIINTIIKENLYDKDFVEKWTYGFDHLRKHVEEYTPERVAEITWLDKNLIIEAARLISTNKPSAIISTNKPSAIFTFMGLAMSGNSTSALRSLGIILAITGNIDVEGSNFVKIPPQTERFRLPKEILKEQLSADKFPILSGPDAIPAPFLPSPNPFDVINAMITEKPYPIKALITDCNPLTALEDSKRVLKALLKLDLLVVLELFMTPTAEFADYVLPITWFLESNSIVEYSGMNFITSRKRVLKPKDDVKEEGEIIIDLMRSMKILDKLPFSTYDEYLDFRLRPLNLNFREFLTEGYVVSPNVEKKYEKGLLRADGKPGFNTPTGKIEIYSTILEKYGYDPLPVYKEPKPGPYTTPELFKEYPFIMITGVRTLPFYHGLGVQIPEFRKMHPDPTVEISREAAERLGLKEGDLVFIEVPGKGDRVQRKVRIVEGLHENVIGVIGHWYLPEESDQDKRLWSANINILTSLRDDYDPVLGGSGCRSMLARIRKV